MGEQGLDFQLVDIVFDKGLDTRTERKNVVPGKWLDLQNVSFSEDNTPRLRDSMTGFVSTKATTLAAHGGELVAVSGGTATEVLVNKKTATANGQVGYVGLGKTPVAQANDKAQLYPDCAYSNGYMAYAWQQATPGGATSGIYLSIIEEATGAHLVDSYLLYASATARSVRLVGTESGVFAFWTNGTNIFAQFVNLTSGAVFSASVTVPNTLIIGRLDACKFNLTDSAYLVVDGTHLLLPGTVFYGVAFTLSGATVVPAAANSLMTTAAIGAGASIKGVCCAMYSNNTQLGAFVVATAPSGGSTIGGVIGVTLDANSGVPGAPAIVWMYDNWTTTANTAGGIHLTACVADGFFPTKTGATLQLFWDAVQFCNVGYGTPFRIYTAAVDPTLTSTIVDTPCNANTWSQTSTVRAPQGPFIAGKAFYSTALKQTFLPVCTLESYSATGATNAQNSVFIMQGGTVYNSATPGAIVGRCLVGLAASLVGVDQQAYQFYASAPCSSPATVAGASFSVAVQEQGRLTLLSGANLTPSGLSRVRMTPAVTSLPNAQLGPSTYIGSGLLSDFDGENAYESGFNLWPEGMLAVVDPTAGSVDAGVHWVTAVYEWTDLQGQRHQSAPAVPVSVTSVAAQSIAVTIPTLQLTQRPNVTIAVYMTQANGLTFYRCGVNAGAGATVLANNKAVRSVSWSIAESDAVIGANPQLYTQPLTAGSTLSNDPPPPMSCMAVHQNRIFCDVTDQPSTYSYSQQLAPGVGLQWSSFLGGSLDATAGAIVGMCELDEKVVILCANKLYAIYGTGPQPSGLNGGYSDPVEIPSDVGCSERRSILRMPQGIMFKSVKGWYLLGRDLSVKYIGEGVKRWDDFDVSSAVLMGDRQECRFTSSNGAPTLVYSYLGDQWSVFSYGSFNAPYAVMDSMWWPSKFASDGFGYVYAPVTDNIGTDYALGNPDIVGGVDQGIPIQVLQTSFLKLGSISGFQRVRWLYFTGTYNPEFNYQSTATVGLIVRFNDDTFGAGPTYITSFSLTPLGAQALNTFDVRHKLLRQKCKSVSFTFNISGGVAPKSVLGLQSLSLVAGVKRGTNKLPAENGMG